MKSTLRSTKKLDTALNGEIEKLRKPNILEFGVQIGSSTTKFIEICKKKMENYFLSILMTIQNYLITSCGNLSNQEMITSNIYLKEFHQKLI